MILDILSGNFHLEIWTAHSTLFKFNNEGTRKTIVELVSVSLLLILREDSQIRHQQNNVNSSKVSAIANFVISRSSCPKLF